MENIKEELIFVINTKLEVSKNTTRVILNKFSFLNPMLLNRLSNYKLDEIKIDKLMYILNKIDERIYGKIFGFSINANISSKSLTIKYLGSV